MLAILGVIGSDEVVTMVVVVGVVFFFAVVTGMIVVLVVVMAVAIAVRVEEAEKISNDKHVARAAFI